MRIAPWRFRSRRRRGGGAGSSGRRAGRATASATGAIALQLAASGGQRRQSGQQMAYAVNQCRQTMRAIGSSIVCQTCLLGERLAVGNAFVALDRARSVIALGLIKRNGRVKALRIPALCRGFSHTADSGFHPRGAFSFHFYLA